MRGQDIIVEPIRLADIFIVGKRRDLRPETVDALANSIETLGLRHPISIRYVDYLDHPVEGELHGAYVLVAGRHRLAAYEKLGRERIECVVVKWDEDEARLWEIAENLHRADLTKLERDEQIAEWVRLTAEKARKNSAPLGGSQPTDRGIRKAAVELGYDEKTVRNAVKVAGISQDAREAAVDAGLADNQSALLKIANLPSAAQVSAVSEIVEAKATRLDTDIKNRAAEEMAEAIVAHMPAAMHGMMKENAWVCAKPLAIALTNLLGQSVMDTSMNWSAASGARNGGGH